MIEVRIFPRWVGGDIGYRYRCELEGAVILEGARVPECEVARILQARGLSGKFTIVDGRTGVPRTIIDIERAAELTVTEGQAKSPRFVKWAPFDKDARRSVAVEAPAAERGVPGVGTPREASRPLASSPEYAE